MEILSLNLPSALLMLAIGIVIGAAINKILNKSANTSELKQQLEETKEQFENYQKEVGSHFQTTAELVNNLTQSYREVHKHLSQGAQSLVQNLPEALEASTFKALGDSSSNENISEPTTTTQTDESVDSESEQNSEHKSDNPVNSNT